METSDSLTCSYPFKEDDNETPITTSTSQLDNHFGIQLQRSSTGSSDNDVKQSAEEAAQTSEPFSWQHPSKEDLTYQLRRSLISDCEDAEGDDPLLHSLDLIEDELDTHATELLPLSFRLALEQNLFGWSHLVSDILVGHVLFISAVAFLTYYLISWICLNNSRHPILEWLHLYSPDTSTTSGGQPIWGSTNTFCALRTSLTVVSAILTFRTIRRRRLIWLRSAYGTQAYERDAQRRDCSVMQVDKTTLLGRIRNTVTEKRAAMRARSISGKLRRAHKRFEKKHLRHYENQRGGKFLSSSYNSQEQPVAKSILQDQVPIPEIDVLPYAHGGFFGAAPFLLGDPIWVNILRELMPDVYVEIAQRIFAPTPKLIHWAENNPVVAAFGTVHEQGVRGRLVALEWDVFLDPYLVNKLQLAIEDVNTCKVDDENVRAELNKKVQAATLILLERMMIAHGSTLQLLVEQTGIWKKFNFSRIKRQRRTLGGGMYARQWLEVYAHALQMAVMGKSFEKNSTSTSNSRSYSSEESSTGVSSSSEDEYIGPESTRLELTSLIRGQTGIDDSDSLIRSKHSRAEKEGKRSHKQHPPIEKHQRTTSNSSAGLRYSTNILESLDIVEKIMGAPVTLVLDLKSRHVPKNVWALLVDALRDCGARVEGVASFVPEEIRGIETMCSLPVKEIYFFHSAGDFQLACHANKLQAGDSIFFNAGSLLWTSPPTQTFRDWIKIAKDCIIDFDVEETKKQYALQPYARIREGDQTCDSAFPFTSGTHCDVNYNYSCHVTIADYKSYYRLNIGVYCQEFAIDDAAIDLLIRFINANPGVFNLGLSWGGVNGLTVKGIQPGRLASTDGFWNQRYVGASWRYDLRPGCSEGI